MNKLGFGALHFPKKDEEQIDFESLNAMVDTYLASGRTFFDTAYTYGNSEWALGEALSKRHPRESFQLCTKLPGYQCEKPEDSQRYFEEELERCKVEYFDVYMLHWLNDKNYRIAEKLGQFDFLKKLKAEGKAKRIGFSFHDTADLLDEILTAHPEVDCVLMQLNYADWESEAIQAHRCYDTAVRHGVSVMVMEPIKGGTLSTLPEKAAQMLAQIDPESTPSAMALRFVESLPGVEIVLSGMSSLQQIEENVRSRKELTEAEREAMLRVAEEINSETEIKCSGCGYCLKGCPQNICIPNYFRMYNEVKRAPGDGWKITPAYDRAIQTHGKASECIACGQCEAHCPQKLPIIDNLKKVAEEFEKKE
ncbi:MAG: aldo/keto reductase [Lachnospiraceae bacterium]|nr:aldo/keto reductase [Lachnospiraceae bacterium]